MGDYLDIDGSFGEGGGQVLRTSLTLAALLGRPIHIHRIRAGRKNPGLAPQHLTTVHAVARVCEAEVRGGRLGSTELWFTPRRPPQAGPYTFDVTEAARGGSAGAITLVFQTVLLPLAYADAPSYLTLRGGTHVPWSPSFHYLANVFLPTVGRLGLTATAILDTWGFYPVGGGQIRAEIQPRDPSPLSFLKKGGAPDPSSLFAPPSQPGKGAGGLGLTHLTALNLTDRGPLKRVSGLAVACNLPAAIAQRIANRATNVLREADGPSDIRPIRERGPGMGAGLFLVAEYANALAGFAALGEKGKPSDQVADEACDALLTHHATDAAVDPHLADQLLLPMALAAGRSVFTTSEVTQHLLTNATIIRQFLPVHIIIEGPVGQPGTVNIEPLPQP